MYTLRSADVCMKHQVMLGSAETSSDADVCMKHQEVLMYA